MLYSMLSASGAWAESVESEFFCAPKADFQWVLEELYNYDVCLKDVRNKDRDIANLQWEINVLKKEIELKDREIALEKRGKEIAQEEVRSVTRDYERQKEVSDSWKKLAEASKPKFDLQNMLPLIAGVIIAIFSVVSK